MDLNATVAALLRDLAAVQSVPQKRHAYRRAAAAIFGLEQPVDALIDEAGTLQKIPAVGPSSTRVVLEVVATGGSPTVERAITAAGKSADVARRRQLSQRFLSRAEALAILADPAKTSPKPAPYLGDLQVHSEWSDGAQPLAALATAALARGHAFLGVTDHSHGLPIARGMSMGDARRQHTEIDRLNAGYAGAFRLLKGVEANIGPDGTLDLSSDELRTFELVLAAPHSALRRTDDQTVRLLRAVQTTGVHILAHPRGRMAGTRGGIVADWPRVFRAAAEAGVAVEIDGDPSRQDLDYDIARAALAAGCLFALDSDAHGTDEFWYTDLARAHARLAGIPAGRIVNCWPTARLVEWLKKDRPATAVAGASRTPRAYRPRRPPRTGDRRGRR
jgi:histidinol phosphatase-like PHP family hydrolase